jgi:hypothetical protein
VDEHVGVQGLDDVFDQGRRSLFEATHLTGDTHSNTHRHNLAALCHQSGRTGSSCAGWCR